MWNGITGMDLPFQFIVEYDSVESYHLIVVYVDDLLNDLRISGYGVYTVSTKSEPIFLL